MSGDVATKPQVVAILQALVDLGGEATPGALAAATEMSARSLSTWRARAADAGLVDGNKMTVRITDHGRHQIPTAPPVAGAGDLDEVLEQVWPTEHHRAFVRLLLSAVIARWHLRADGPDAHLGFVAAGATGTGKSAMGNFVARVLGLEPAAHTVWLPRASPGAVGGRREPSGGGGFEFVAPAHFGLPLVLLEEADPNKTDPAILKAARGLLQGVVVTYEEGQQVDRLATPLLTANTLEGRARDLVGDEYVRRSVVLDAWHLAPLCGDLGARLRRLELAGGPPRLDLDAMRPPATRLTDDAMATLEAALDGGQVGPADRPGPALEAAALGRAALAGTDDLGHAAFETAVDFLMVADTCGRSTGVWQVRAARDAMAANPTSRALATRLDGLDATRSQVAEAARARRTEANVVDLELVRAREQCRGYLQTARDRIKAVPVEHRPAAKGLRAVLTSLDKTAATIRSREALADLEALAADPLTEALALRERIDAEKRQAAAALEQQRRHEAAARQAAQQAAAQHRQQQAAAKKAAGAQLDRLRPQLAQIEQLWRRKSTKPDEDPLTVLKEIVHDGRPLVAFELPAQRPTGVLDRLAGAHRYGRWVTADRSTSWSGTRTGCDALAKWGPDTQRVLEQVLRPGYALEDQLADRAGRKPRSRRCAIAAS